MSDYGSANRTPQGPGITPPGGDLATRLRELAGKATPGPWWPLGDSLYAAPKPPPPAEPYDDAAWDDWYDTATELFAGEVWKTPDVESIAAFDPQTILRLLDVVDAARETNDCEWKAGTGRYRWLHDSLAALDGEEA